MYNHGQYIAEVLLIRDLAGGGTYIFHCDQNPKKMRQNRVYQFFVIVLLVLYVLVRSYYSKYYQ